MNTQQVAVLGLGRFGVAVANELTRLGHEVLAVDRNEQAIREISQDVTHAVEADITDEDTLRELGIGALDAAIVAVASNLEASILSTVVLKRIGVPTIVAKAGTEIHGAILEQVGANRVAYPERETGVRLAHSFAAPAVRDYLDVAPGYGMARVPVQAEWVNRTLADLDLPGKYRLTIIALTRGNTVTLNPRAGELIHLGDDLTIAGLDEDLARLPASTLPRR